MIDASIALQGRLPQFDNPLTGYGQVAQIQNVQNQGRMFDMDMQSKMRAQDDQNALSGAIKSNVNPLTGEVNNAGVMNMLAQNGSGHLIQDFQKSALANQKTTADIGSTNATAAKSSADVAKTRFDVIGQTLGSLTQIPNGAQPQQVQTAMQHLVDIGMIDPSHVQSTLATMPTDPSQMQGWLLQSQKAVLAAKEQLPKFEKTDTGGNVATGTVDPASGVYTPGVALPKSQSPDSIANNATSAANNASTNATSRANNAATNATSRANNDNTNSGGHGGMGGQVDPNSPATGAIVQAIIDGRKTLTPAEMKGQYGQDMLNLVAQKDPSFDLVNYNARAKTRNDFVAGKSAENIKGINTAIAHIGQLDTQMTALNNGGSAALNSASNWAGSNLLMNSGLQNRIASVNTTAEGVAGEMAKVFRQTGMSEGEINAWRSKFNTNSTPGAQQGTMQSAMHMLDGRLQALGDQYQTGMGTTAQPLQMLTPQSQATVDRLSGKKPAGATPANIQSILDKYK